MPLWCPPINPKVGWQMIFETGPIVVSAHNSQEQAALKALNTFMEPSVQAKWDQLQAFTSPESAVKVTDPTAIAVASEIKAEHVTLNNRYWEATPPQIAVPSPRTCPSSSSTPTSRSCRSCSPCRQWPLPTGRR